MSEQPGRNPGVREYGLAFRQIRTITDSSQQQVADALKMDNGKLSRIERGEVAYLPITVIQELADYYGYSLDEVREIAQFVQSKISERVRATSDNHRYGETALDLGELDLSPLGRRNHLVDSRV